MEKKISVRSYLPNGLDKIIGNTVYDNIIVNSSETGFCRYYGIFEDEKQIGTALYSVKFGNSTFELDRIDIEPSYQRQGYGTILLEESIKDLVSDVYYLENLNVCSFPWSIEFYLKNGFEPYFGDNNLRKAIRRNDFSFDKNNIDSYKNVINGEEIKTEWYQENALRTLNYFRNEEILRLNAYMGIIGECGEFFDYIKKLYTHDLNMEKQEEVQNLAPKELGDVVWYLVTSLAEYYNYSFDEVYDEITGLEEPYGYDIDIIYAYIEDDFNKDKIFEEMMRFKTVLNKLDTVQTREETIKIVAELMKEIARILKGLFGRRLSDILYSNIDKLRKRYPEGFSTVVSNYRIDSQKKYKEEDSMKVLRKANQDKA